MIYPLSYDKWLSAEELNKGFSFEETTKTEPSSVELKVSGGLLEEPRPEDAGIDIKSVVSCQVRFGGTTSVKTGIYLEIPEGYVGLLCPRSGLAKNEGITLVNSPGIIDSNYRGELIVILTRRLRGSYSINYGDRIAQLVIIPSPVVKLQHVDKLSESNRGSDGFGSSGR